MTDSEYHMQRRMFAVWHGTVLVAPERYNYSHYEWLIALFGNDHCHDVYTNAIRGYVLDGRMVAYVGHDFSPRMNQQEFQKALKVMEKLVEVKEVAFGANPGQVQPWPPKSNIHLVEDYWRLALKDKTE